MDQDRQKLALFGKKLAKIGSFKLHVWFIGLGILATVPIQVLAALQGPAVGPFGVLLRVILGFGSFSLAIAVFLWLIFRTKVD